MREIKFRAWDKKEKRWFSPTIDSSGVAITEEKHEEGCPSCGGTIRGTHTIEYPNDYELLQYTGLKDKNGKEIWEGDILLRSHYKYRVEFDGGAFGVYMKHYGWKNLRDFKVEIGEIVGNIYENPELLNK